MRAVAARFLPEEWAAVAPVVDAFARAIFDEARRRGIHDPIEAYRADAVLAALTAAGTTLGIDLLATTATGTPTSTPTAAPGAESTDPGSSEAEGVGPMTLAEVMATPPKQARWNVSILIDGIALKRGHATATETCEIVGVGPVDVAWVQQILPDALVDVLVHDMVDIQAYATTTRYRPRALDRALQARDRTCVVAGCRREGHLQVDHRHDYHRGGPTSGKNLERLCVVHHHEKTHGGAVIERTDTEWLWYPPAPKPGEPEPPPGSIPWRTPIGAHLTAFDLTDLPPPGQTEPDDTLPFVKRRAVANDTNKQG
jgi:hypothetical protein